MKYKSGDIIENPTFEEMDKILDNYNAEWVGIGVLKIVSEKEINNASST